MLALGCVVSRLEASHDALDTTNYLYDGPNLVEEVDGAGMLLPDTRKGQESITLSQNFEEAPPATISRIH